MPDSDVEVFTERSDERRQIFEDAASRLPTTELSPLVWAFLQVCDLDSVNSFALNETAWKLVKLEALGDSTLDILTRATILLWK